jgi:spore coat polysaccharide biosynthesis protein SpsF
VSIVAVIQARMTSTRLPGKVLMQVMGRPMLAYQVERVARAKRVDRIVLATTTNTSDDAVAAFAQDVDIGLYRGSEHDVLQRVTEAARSSRAEGQPTAVVRLTADCPLIDPNLIDAVVDRLTDAQNPVDYASNAIPRCWPIGLDVEAMTFEALSQADREATDVYDREHVTPFLYRQPNRFRLGHVPSPEPLSQHRWTLDEPADFALLSGILTALYPSKPHFGYRDVLDLLQQRPDLSQLNAGVAQKTRRFEDIVGKALSQDGHTE